MTVPCAVGCVCGKYLITYTSKTVKIEKIPLLHREERLLSVFGEENNVIIG